MQEHSWTMCLTCSNIPKLESFKKQILQRKEETGEDNSKQDTTRIRNECLTSKRDCAGHGEAKKNRKRKTTSSSSLHRKLLALIFSRFSPRT